MLGIIETVVTNSLTILFGKRLVIEPKKSQGKLVMLHSSQCLSQYLNTELGSNKVCCFTGACP